LRNGGDALIMNATQRRTIQNLTVSAACLALCLLLPLLKGRKHYGFSFE